MKSFLASVVFICFLPSLIASVERPASCVQRPALGLALHFGLFLISSRLILFYLLPFFMVLLLLLCPLAFSFKSRACSRWGKPKEKRRGKCIKIKKNKHTNATLSMICRFSRQKSIGLFIPPKSLRLRPLRTLIWLCSFVCRFQVYQLFECWPYFVLNWLLFAHWEMDLHPVSLAWWKINVIISNLQHFHVINFFKPHLMAHYEGALLPIDQLIYVGQWLPWPLPISQAIRPPKQHPRTQGNCIYIFHKSMVAL